MNRRTIAFALAAVLAAATVEAHISVQPRESKPGATERYALRVPTEGAVATTSIELEVPDGVTVVSADPTDGVAPDLKRVNGRIASIGWNVTIAPGQNRTFTFTASNPAQGASLAWRAHQKFADGTQNDWTGPAGSPRPAAITTLAAGGSR